MLQTCNIYCIFHIFSKILKILLFSGLTAWEDYPTLKMLMEMVMTKLVNVAFYRKMVLSKAVTPILHPCGSTVTTHTLRVR